MAYYVDTLDEYVRNITVMCDAHTNLTSLKIIIEAWRLANAPTLVIPVYDPVRNVMLKIATECIVGLKSDLNCYPTGLTTSLLFDIDGNLIP